MHRPPAVRTVRHDINTKPFIVIWEVTRACGLVCKHCRADAQHEPHPDQLTTEEGKRLLDALSSYEKPLPLVVFTGGDPFERADLEELTEYGTSKGLNVSLSPSVTPKLTPERIQSLREAGGKAMSMSLDGATAKTHDAFRGFSGTFEKTVEMAPVINEAGYRLQINSTLTRDNIGEAPALLKKVIEMGAKMWYVFFLVPTGRGAALNCLSPEEREDVLNWLVDISDRIAIKTTEAPQYRRVVLQRREAEETGAPKYEGGPLYDDLTRQTTELLGEHPEKPRPPRSPMAVNSGSGFAFIDHIGDVYPNGFLPLHCGNVKETDFPEIYSESPVFKELRDPDNWHGKCSVCGFHNVCGGSRSTAFALTGDYRASDPTCVYVPPAWHPDADAVEGDGATADDLAKIGSGPGEPGVHTPALKLTVVDGSKGM
ncbi:TIGR04053 family radical SAM/SPASM domain-containing protein [Corynebacterium sp.]|uniref:TIGR04053 family radical SAM/SPASM domain-containing protein n=1 Tax=Corynebacterium sp. TaxID=1720 RepID=UPI0025C04FBE|nr:TIGR04053 family radical SAM/SPASM domain-containing protein [Corynebacterium sp.]